MKMLLIIVLIGLAIYVATHLRVVRTPSEEVADYLYAKSPALWIKFLRHCHESPLYDNHTRMDKQDWAMFAGTCRTFFIEYGVFSGFTKEEIFKAIDTVIKQNPS